MSPSKLRIRTSCFGSSYPSCSRAHSRTSSSRNHSLDILHVGASRNVVRRWEITADPNGTVSATIWSIILAPEGLEQCRVSFGPEVDDVVWLRSNSTSGCLCNIVTKLLSYPRACIRTYHGLRKREKSWLYEFFYNQRRFVWDHQPNTLVDHLLHPNRIRYFPSYQNHQTVPSGLCEIILLHVSSTERIGLAIAVWT